MKSSEINTIEKVKYKKDIFNIRWRVTTLCNYQCAFCIQGSPEEHARQARGESAELRNSICDKIVRLVESAENHYRVVTVSLIGGEVTILKDFPDILARLVRSDFSGDMRFSITTNFSAAPDYYQCLIKPFQTADSHKNRVLSLSASFYPEYVSIEQFSRKLREIYRFAGNKKHAFRSLFKKAGLAKRDCLSLSAGIPIFNNRDFDMFVKIKDSFKDTDIRISPIIIRKYDTDLSDETLKSYIARGEKNLRVTDIYGKTRYYPTIQALGASLNTLTPSARPDTFVTRVSGLYESTRSATQKDVPQSAVPCVWEAFWMILFNYIPVPQYALQITAAAVYSGKSKRERPKSKPVKGTT